MQACAGRAGCGRVTPDYNAEASPRGIALGMTDGLGRRDLATDAATGDPVEQLDLSLDLVLNTSFTTTLSERVARLASVRHASYVRVHRVDRPSIDRLVVVSDAMPGHRLSEVLAASASAGIRPDIEAVVSLLRQLLPAAALFSRHNRDAAIGTIAAERLFVAPPARVIIADAWFGPAIDQLGLLRDEAWQRFRIAAPPSDQPVVSSPRGDATALGVVALSMLLGRPMTADEFPRAVPALLSVVRERHGDEDHPLSSVLSRWLRRALQLDEGGFESLQAAQIAFEDVLASNRRYVTGTAALERWVETCIPAPVPAPVLDAPAALDAAADVSAAAEPLASVPAPVVAGGPRVLGLKPLWAAVVLAVVLLQAGVIGWYWSRPDEGPAEGQGELVVSSRPTGARVVVDGTDRGATPLTLTLSAGAHVVEVRAGNGEPRVIPMVIRANVQTVQYVELQEESGPPPAGARPPAAQRR